MTDIQCRATFKGEMTKEHFYILLKYIDDMKLRGWEFEKHDRVNLKNGNMEIDYSLIKINESEAVTELLKS